MLRYGKIRINVTVTRNGANRTYLFTSQCRYFQAKSITVRRNPVQ